MIEIGINKISKSFGFDKIFNDLSFEVKTGERIALIGENGSGKSTILNVITGIESVDSGNISVRNNRKIGYLRQNTNYIDNSCLVKDVLYSNIKEIIDMKLRLSNLEKEMLVVNNSFLDKIIEKYTKLQERFIDIGGYEVDSKIEKIVNGFNIDKGLLDKKFGVLSGGEKTIISLASIIIMEPDILLLDEPTNHLDINTLKWLENYLINYKGTILMVSHDRYFLNKVATKIILLERGNVEIFSGNYDYYKIENDNRIFREFKEYKDQQKLIKSMKNKIKQLEEFGRLANPGGEGFFKRANSIRKRLEKISLLDKPIVKKEIPINFDIGKRSGDEVLIAKNINISYGSKVILDNANFEIYYNDRVCLYGKNGCGKSSLIKDILNKNIHYKFGTNINIGYIPQEIVFDNMNITVLEEAMKYFVGEEYQLRSALFKFEFFKDNVFKRLNVLSGGEKVRLKLFCIIQKNINFLILDEITNHIDISTREVLENALEEFNGTILFISHDRYFINKIANRVLYFDNNQLYSFHGNYDEFIVKKSTYKN